MKSLSGVMYVFGKFATDRGKVREINEDSGGVFYNLKTQLLAIVADGLGGHLAGEVASLMAASHVKEAWESSETLDTPEQIETWLSEIIEEINQSIYEKSLEKPAYKGMGTTNVISICRDDFVTIANVGDSRCYLISQSEFKQITTDHTLVNELLRTGQISAEDAEMHPRKNALVRAVGTEETVKSEIITIGWEKDDQLLLCSDGLTNKLSDEELESLFRKESDLNVLAEQLIGLANERGGEDNITLAIVQNKQQEKVGDPTC